MGWIHEIAKWACNWKVNRNIAFASQTRFGWRAAFSKAGLQRYYLEIDEDLIFDFSELLQLSEEEMQ